MNEKIVAHIIEKFGTQERLGQAIGCHQSTIAWWKKRGVIPVRQQSKLLDAAKQLGVDLSPADFFREPPSESATPGGHACSPATGEAA